MSHPKIPPNCPYFGGPVDSAMWFRHYGYQIKADVHLGTGHAMSVKDADKHIIACVARSYWLDEAERLETSVWGETMPSQALDAALQALSSAYNEASAWKKWGEGEKK